MKICENGIYRDMTEDEIAEYNQSSEETAKLAKEQEVEEMKKDLASSDYKVIKCMECYLLGKEMPYDIHTLHEERQSKRDEINGLEKEEQPKWY